MMLRIQKNSGILVQTIFLIKRILHQVHCTSGNDYTILCVYLKGGLASLLLAMITKICVVVLDPFPPFMHLILCKDFMEQAPGVASWRVSKSALLEPLHPPMESIQLHRFTPDMNCPMESRIPEHRGLVARISYASGTSSSRCCEIKSCMSGKKVHKLLAYFDATLRKRMRS